MTALLIWELAAAAASATTIAFRQVLKFRHVQHSFRNMNK